MAASALLAAGGAGCDRKPRRKIVSMAEAPEYQKPGIPLRYASTWTEGRIPYGMMVKTVDGRPVKIEGLPGHPLNRGASSAQMQASILSLYDPDRLRSPVRRGRRIGWEEADREIVDALRGANSVLLITRSTLGPSERAIVARFLQACPAARHIVHETIHDGPRRAAWKKIYRTDGELTPDFAKARIALSLDSDFLGTDGDVLRAARDFASTRNLWGADPRGSRLSRLYVVESSLSVTGSNADHRLPLKPSAMLPLVRALRSALGGDGARLDELVKEAKLDGALLAALVKDLKEHRGESVVVAGPHLSEAAHAAVALLNQEIEAGGKTLSWNPSPAALPVDPMTAIEQAARGEQRIDAIIFLGVNLAHDWDAGRGGGEATDRFARLISRANLTVGHGACEDETLSACELALPSAHNLESWNDAMPLPGLHALCQPVIAPIFDARQEAESLLVWTRMLAPGDAELAACPDWHAFVRGRWTREVLSSSGDPRAAWEDALRRGLAGSPLASHLPPLDRKAAEALAAAEGGPAPAGGLELVVLPHHAAHDGRFASSGWLQELPDPVSRLVWDNGAAISPQTARDLGVEEGDWIELSLSAGRPALDGGARSEDGARSESVILPVLVQPGVARGVVATTLGQGRTRGGAAGTGVGFNTARLVALAAETAQPSPWFSMSIAARALSAEERKRRDLPRKHSFVRTQKTFSMHDRPIVRHGTFEEYRTDPSFAKKRSHVPELRQLDEEFDYSAGPKWEMAIDLNACTGCGACVIACQAENNIPVVGKEECALGREMHWIRIDRYEGGADAEANPHVYQQPMLCQHCDNAPCETVCPVNATTHSPEGLNEQVYNRCVGTRYCANNCPYKVRRFNFYDYQGRQLRESVQELVFNPQVTVRSRGVMEKCTFCVQRISEVTFRLKSAGKEVPDGAIRTACQQACPAEAIVFGNANDPGSKVARMRASSLAYRVLEELNVRPGITYLARVIHSHPDAAGGDPGEKEESHG
ncbi:MAG: 4Fe-4S dicluster domain-containing protein [Planctomycetes bacterium]|nr:4Fe-4S dicluster domain-containing protein [Planctomycetota bacterium]